eukprot:TRINITY_DN370_c0_g1_i1.p1 TRINITY_DN370_c0_g1~~TRINITY_DN370_c0_g1_i1.p1  ORF type:complete len:317 (-),score=97.82 TRINITY_DN370_c0_g1_i1:118-996(-)
MTHQAFFVWPHGSKFSVHVAGSFSGWGLIPLTKQGNYYFQSLALDDGVYHYKFYVDGVWQYDLGQPHEDDGSGNWNNYLEFGVESEPVAVAEPVVEHKAQATHAPTHAPQTHQDNAEDKPLSKKQQKKQAKQQEKAAQKQQQQQQGGGGGKKQQKGAGATPKHAPEPEPEAEAQAQDETEQPETTEDVSTELVAEETTEPAKPVKTPETVVTVDVVAADTDIDMVALEQFVRSVQPPGLKWEGSSVSDYVFGLKKLTIICKCRDDVSVEDVCTELEKNGDMIGSAQIQSFAC